MRSDMLVLGPQLSDESIQIHLFMDVGSCLKMLGRWFECLFMYNGSSLGFLYFPGELESLRRVNLIPL